ncbi:MAG: FAD-dependent oxidoreductase [Waddliaceae bacterium]
MIRPKVVIIGGGFGGLNAAKGLKKANVDVLLIDRYNHHLFQPLLYQVASAALSPGNIAQPLRELLRKKKNVDVVMGNVSAIDKEKRELLLSHGDCIPYDYLIVAPGARQSYFGNDEWETHAPGLKSISDATGIREKVLPAFEKAERIDDKDVIAKYLRFVVVGGGLQVWKCRRTLRCKNPSERIEAKGSSSFCLCR